MGRVNEVRAKKELGQHFLIDLDIACRIAMAVETTSCANVIEVGPGMGVLTQFLLKREDVNLKVIEIDTESVDYLKKNYGDRLKDKIVEGDFIKYNFDETTNVIGNFPYNISTQIFFKVLENRDLVPSVVGMLQKEVAARLAADAGKRAGGVLSILLQAFYDVEYLFEVDADRFSPPPKVQSAVIRCTRNNVVELGCDEAAFKRVVKGAFSPRRKMLKNAIYASFPRLAQQKVEHEFFKMRAENLNIAQFVELTNFVELYNS